MLRHLLPIAALTLLVATQLSAQDARFSVRSDLVVLHVSVTDRAGRFVSELPANAFHVFDEGQPQTVSFFVEQDAPATIALLIDGSGSMMKNRDRIVAGIASLAEASHPDDEFLPLLFNERLIHVLPPQTPFTDDSSRLRLALTEGLGARGRTALHDSVAETLEELGRGHHERKVLIVLSDGGDNASRSTFDAMLSRVLTSNVVIYGVSLQDPLSLDRDPRALRRIAEATGGIAYEPRRAGDVTRVLKTIASDIRSRYTLAYAPDVQEADDRLRHVRVRVDAPGRERINVRTRTGYVAGGANPATSERQETIR